MPTKKQIKEFYEAEGARGDHQEGMYFNPHANPNSIKRFQTVLRLLRKYVPGRRFLEIGCAEGVYCEYARMYQASLVVGADISRNKIKRCKRCEDRTVYMVMDWEDMPFTVGEFDIALASECIEHSRKPQKLVDDLLHVSHSIIVTLPLEPKLLSNPLADKANGHLHLFTPETARELFDKYKTIEDFGDEYYFYAVVSRK